ncbi:hypothetical protein M9H77_35945 [Catharanthus roseus]|uniref:Uncharacterized protein n=1 Tax=Catharanthus roseus TaxID=4058 RepID=A0ACB9ZQQ8_CATRO|nr:hypothetical protein M9H77_35945 [Catharanthus roseus]
MILRDEKLTFRDKDIISSRKYSQEVKDLLHGPFTIARQKKIKDNDGNVDNGMVVYMENTLKIKLEEKRTPTNDGSPTPTTVGRPLDGNGLEANNPTFSTRFHPTVADRVRVENTPL